MPTRKINDINDKSLRPCRDPDHNPASHVVREPGTYEHECPSCGRKFTFTVTRPYL